MHYYDLQEKLLCCDKHTLLGRWIELARSWGNNETEKSYFEFQARTLITLWGDRAGANELHDYAAREWDGMIQDFYRPRWESYINVLRWCLVTGNKPMDYNRYDVEFFFTIMSKDYPTEPYGDLKVAAECVNELIK
jgi:alpha-N-acetylglucosaminidase